MKRIQVLFAFQSHLSGIHDPDFHDIVWYSRKVRVPDSFAGKRVLLHFGAVDYEAAVWVNGQQVACHEGGHTPFFSDITEALVEGDITLVVKAVDSAKLIQLLCGVQGKVLRRFGIEPGFAIRRSRT
ncbi:sugar-binding domain-containing protein [Paenibacillus harenae]|uniref:sugar-binding domain-containing protein n=1 Tax=Paenibacillus harenae TaxID=306543 RepID=UPI001FE0B7BC|nr:sugar-binding domain-containing protein [Paenibacillus harenae]